MPDTVEKLIKLFHGQAKSADLWINEWRRYQDVGSVKNAALAIGKMAGIYYSLSALLADDDPPSAVTEKFIRYHRIWDELKISREIAAAISKHG